VSFDIRFNRDYQWVHGAQSGKFDIETVNLHEVGHAIGLGHTTASSAEVMYPSISSNRVKGLGAGDLSGVAGLYPAANPPAGGGDPVEPILISPDGGSVLPCGSTTFTWDAEPAYDYWVYLGSPSASSAYADSGNLGTASQYESSTLPLDGSMVTLTLWWRQPGEDWQTIRASFTACSAEVPGSISVTAPTGNASSFPTYAWNPDPVADSYRLWVTDVTGNPVNQWLTAEQAGCAGGNGECNYRPNTEVTGAATVWVQGRSGAFRGPWSSGLTFSAPAGLPSAPGILAPTGASSQPTYRWIAVDNSSWYRVWVDDATGTPVKVWVTALEAGCGDGEGTCSYRPTAAISGSATVWVRSWNADPRSGKWSAGFEFG
jgi:hypothetical protein